MKWDAIQNSTYFKIALSVGLFILLSIVLSQKINLVTADLGRHIKNGEYFFQNWQPIKTNYYSYTMTDEMTVNHHWLSGVLFYLAHTIAGFYGLSLFYVGVYLLALLLLFWISVKKSTFYPTLLAFIICIPLFAHRREIRPELFSYLGVILYLFYFETNKLRNKYWPFGILLVYQLFWANSHIYAFFGPLISSLYITGIIIKGKLRESKRQVIFWIISVLCLVITPFGLTGLLKSLSIMNQYGYRLAENMSLWFMINWSRGSNWVYGYSLFTILIVFGLIAFKWIKNRKFQVLDILVIGMGFSSLVMNRNLPLFGIVTVLWIAKWLDKILDRVKASNWIVLVCVVGLFIYLGKFGLVNANTGMGLQSGVERSAQFYKTQKIRGPIFNNYDNGGYLIFELFPQEKVFVDNRPEAYDKKFFDQIYNPSLADENKWNELNEKNNFNVIYFYRHDMTDNAQAFLLRRTQDPKWIPIYVDDWMILLVKNEEKNQSVINKYGLPREMFSQKN